MTGLQVSNCCRDGLIVRGDTTQHWTCRNCGKPCDTMTNPAAPVTDPGITVHKDCGGPVIWCVDDTGLCTRCHAHGIPLDRLFVRRKPRRSGRG